MNTYPELLVRPSIYSGPFPNFKQPKIIGFIGLENLKFARQVNESHVQYDLNMHYEKAIHKPIDRDPKLKDILLCLLENQIRLNYYSNRSLESALFICYRGLMTCIACTPYENREPWKIVAILYKGNIYLCARETSYKAQRRQNMTDRDMLFTSWGHKFEHYILSDTPDTEPNTDLPVNENEEFSLVFSTNLNRHRIVYGAEMDGIRCDKHPVPQPPDKDQGVDTIIQYLSTKEFIELKTNRHIEYPNQEKNFRRFKALKWWCQSFLTGVETILGGFRNDDGIVEQLRLISVKDLPKMSQRFWQPNVCFTFLDNFFTYVKRCLARKIRRSHGDTAHNNLQTLPLISMMFEWEPGMPVTVNENYSYEDDPILADWFVNNYGKGAGETFYE